MYLCCLLSLRDILSYCYGAIWPICAESAVKPQTSKQTNKQYRGNSVPQQWTLGVTELCRDCSNKTVPAAVHWQQVSVRVGRGEGEG